MGRMGCLLKNCVIMKSCNIVLYLLKHKNPFENNRSVVDITVRGKQKEKTTNLNSINFLCNLFEIKLSKLIKNNLF
jgi:hypothetical protein